MHCAGNKANFSVYLQERKNRSTLGVHSGNLILFQILKVLGQQSAQIHTQNTVSLIPPCYGNNTFKTGRLNTQHKNDGTTLTWLQDSVWQHQLWCNPQVTNSTDGISREKTTCPRWISMMFLWRHFLNLFIKSHYSLKSTWLDQQNNQSHQSTSPLSKWYLVTLKKTGNVLLSFSRLCQTKLLMWQRSCVHDCTETDTHMNIGYIFEWQELPSLQEVCKHQ